MRVQIMMNEEKANNKNVSLSTNELAAGNYFIEIQKDSVTMKKQVIIIE